MGWSRFHNSVYGYEMLTWIDIDFFILFYYTYIFFQSHRSTLGLLNIKIKLLYFFIPSTRMARLHDLNNKFVMLPQINISFFFNFII